MASSSAMFEQAQRYIPGGVNSPVRAFGAVGASPLFIDKASQRPAEKPGGAGILD